MIEAYQIEAISIGNGTASRETEDFINRQTFDRQIPVFMVSEQGAFYLFKFSKIARDEFPTMTLQYGEQSLSAAVSWTHWRNWLKSIPNLSA